MPIDLILIHGTFDTDAAWTASDSAMVTSFKRELGMADQNLIRFPWTGQNTMDARQRARDALRELLHARVVSDPESRFLMVAHSHGGNIALGALGDERLASRCAGLVCIATPFLEFGPRKFGKFAVAPLYGVGIAVALLVAGAYWRFAWAWASCPPGICTNTFGDIAGLLGAAVAVAMLIMIAIMALPVAAIGRLRARLKVPETDLMPLGVPLGLIRAAGDEANAGLGAARNLCILCTTLWRWCIGIWGRAIFPWITALLGLVGLVALVGGGVAFALNANSGLAVLGWAAMNLGNLLVLCLAVIALFCFVVGATFAVPALVVMPLIGFLVGVSWVGYGRDTALMALFVDVFVEASPPGEWSVCLLEQVRGHDESKDAKQYVHSRICHDPKAVAWITRWVRKHFVHIAFETRTTDGT